MRAARDPGRCVSSTARARSAGGQHGVVSSTRRVRVVTGTPTAGQAAFSLFLSLSHPPLASMSRGLCSGPSLLPYSSGAGGLVEFHSVLARVSTPQRLELEICETTLVPLLSRPEHDTACPMLLCDGFPSSQLTV